MSWNHHVSVISGKCHLYVLYLGSPILSLAAGRGLCVDILLTTTNVAILVLVSWTHGRVTTALHVVWRHGASTALLLVAILEDTWWGKYETMNIFITLNDTQLMASAWLWYRQYVSNGVSQSYTKPLISWLELTHWGWNKMVVTLQITFFNSFSWMKNVAS